MQWQPIETAPKDGTPILLTGGKPCWAFYLPEEDIPAVTARWYFSQHERGCWLIGISEEGYVNVVYTDPTHWMPLPPLPVMP